MASMERSDLNIPISRHFDPKEEKYDAIIIGAGMSGMAAAIRLAMFDQKVLLLEKHTISGGLNSYYARKRRNFDVGLHALTNFAGKKEKGRPLTKLLKQLRLPYDELELVPQKKSLISFPDKTLEFTNSLEDFKLKIEENFPNEKENFEALLEHITSFNETALDNPYQSAKEVVGSFIKDSELLEMIFCPLLIYGSAWEDDMDFSQFVIMFKSIYLEGFSRSRGGVRRIIKMLLNRLEEVGAEVCFRNGVENILVQKEEAYGVITTRGQKVFAPVILSSAGYPETLNMIEETHRPEFKVKPRVGKMSFTETILITNKKPSELGLKDTIIFHNNRPTYQYKRPEGLIDSESAVLCFPNNFEEDDFDEGVLRVTFMANYHSWKELDKADYLEQKENVYKKSLKVLQKYLPQLTEEHVVFKDVFTPTTVERYTGHHGGCVYGTPDKSRDGTTPIKNLFLCGTDQGFLGIVGSMLSGISMANLYGLMKSQNTTAAAPTNETRPTL